MPDAAKAGTAGVVGPMVRMADFAAVLVADIFVEILARRGRTEEPLVDVFRYPEISIGGATTRETDVEFLGGIVVIRPGDGGRINIRHGVGD